MMRFCYDLVFPSEIFNVSSQTPFLGRNIHILISIILSLRSSCSRRYDKRSLDTGVLRRGVNLFVLMFLSRYLKRQTVQRLRCTIN